MSQSKNFEEPLDSENKCESENFAGATEILSEKKYTTISLMYSILAVINQKLIPDDNSDEVLQEEGTLTALLDLRFKDLKFASESLCIRTYEQLKNTYLNMRNLTDKDQEVKFRAVSSNSLLARIFQDNINCADKVANYLALPNIHLDDYSNPDS
ncbi:10012_t:CDS:2 [Funneliformis caledonium]|uniref:10012_t:CDS:1 n=1 Tax=Funneliformis caledonium TaxID=1117310 RepID=A0A9N9H118_9GLOM|nr:10012_t:CDS:2 [Funneliformis caledonium]